MLGSEVYLKLENLQPTGAFKVRGGVNYMARMVDEALSRGVITASTGNHAQSVAYAGQLFGVDVKVVMPHGVPALKTQAVQELGAEIITHGDYYDLARGYAEKLAAEKGYLYIHGINEPLLYEGVGTMHLEVVEEIPDVNVVINPIGGGSGASSACIVYKSINPDIRVIGVQAEGAPAFHDSWKRGAIVSTGSVSTMAEGLATAQAYELPLKLMRGRIDDIILVSDAEMMRAVKTLFHTDRQVAELAGAASTAAAFRLRERLVGKKVALILTGGNIQPDLLARILQA